MAESCSARLPLASQNSGMSQCQLTLNNFTSQRANHAAA
jgi:hypothetical protein